MGGLWIFIEQQLLDQGAQELTPLCQTKSPWPDPTQNKSSRVWNISVCLWNSVWSWMRVFVVLCFMRLGNGSQVYRRSWIRCRFTPWTFDSAESNTLLRKKKTLLWCGQKCSATWTFHDTVLTHPPAGSPGKLIQAYFKDIPKTDYMCRLAHTNIRMDTHTVRASGRKLCQSAKVINKGLLSTLSNWLPCCLLSAAFNLTRSAVDRGSYYSWLYQYCNEGLWYQLTTACHGSNSMQQEVKQ